MQKTLFKAMKRNFGGFASTYHVSLPKLDYDYADLEPVISRENLELHHKKHHNAYITNYNKFIDLQVAAMDKGDITCINKLAPKIKFNLGSHINHSLYWKMLAPPKSNSLFFNLL
jgi:Fe-Mn family superoxide dismutase